VRTKNFVIYYDRLRTAKQKIFMIPKKVCDLTCGQFNVTGKHFDTAMFILRVVLAFAFIYHGWMKVGDMSKTVEMFAGMGISETFAYIASYVELVGGVALLLGGATRLVTVLLGIFMLEAINLVHLDRGYNVMAGGFEYQLLILAGLVVLFLVGPGKFSIHRTVCAD
jgi:putative oxidoreductase